MFTIQGATSQPITFTGEFQEDLMAEKVATVQVVEDALAQAFAFARVASKTTRKVIQRFNCDVWCSVDETVALFYVNEQCDDMAPLTILIALLQIVQNLESAEVCHIFHSCTVHSHKVCTRKEAWKVPLLYTFDRLSCETRRLPLKWSYQAMLQNIKYTVCMKYMMNTPFDVTVSSSSCCMLTLFIWRSTFWRRLHSEFASSVLLST